LPRTPLIHGRIVVSNGLDRTLQSVRFPIIDQPRQLGADASRDCLLLPHCDGILVRNPSDVGWLPTLSYPGGASLQAVARYNDRAGLFLATFDASGQTKQFSNEKRGKTLRMAITHTLSLVRGGSWQSDYDVAFGTFHGDWQCAADLYKAWAVKQPWCARTLAQRVAAGDVPRWIAEPSLFYAWSLRGQLTPQTFGNRLPQTAAQADAWQTLLDAPTTLMLMSWEKHGPWITPDYFPPSGGETAFTDTVHQLHAKGHHAFVFLSGLNWTLLKDRPRDGKHTEGVPFFTHVYHAYIDGYGGDSCGVSETAQASALYQQGMNLVCGKAPGVAVWTRAYAPAQTDAAQTRLLRDHVRLWKTAPEFLVYGDRLATPPLDVPATTNRFWVGANQPPRELAVPSVLHSVWRAPDGRTATVYVCIAATYRSKNCSRVPVQHGVMSGSFQISHR